MSIVFVVFVLALTFNLANPKHVCVVNTVKKSNLQMYSTFLATSCITITVIYIQLDDVIPQLHTAISQ